MQTVEECDECKREMYNEIKECVGNGFMLSHSGHLSGREFSNIFQDKSMKDE